MTVNDAFDTYQLHLCKARYILHTMQARPRNLQESLSDVALYCHAPLEHVKDVFYTLDFIDSSDTSVKELTYDAAWNRYLYMMYHLAYNIASFTEAVVDRDNHRLETLHWLADDTIKLLCNYYDEFTDVEDIEE